jgi:hypothetical protein
VVGAVSPVVVSGEEGGAVAADGASRSTKGRLADRYQRGALSGGVSTFGAVSRSTGAVRSTTVRPLLGFSVVRGGTGAGAAR